jgi:cobalt-zinc-cadmium efflux system membrane fusion protein
MKQMLRVSGVIDMPPQNLVSISFPLGGYLKSTQLLPGLRIAKGEVIAVMEDQSFVQLQQDYLMAKVRLNLLANEQTRQQDLDAGDATSKKALQQAIAATEEQKVSVKALSEKLRIIGIDPDHLSVEKISRTVQLRSPINGYVSKVNVNIGKYVNPADVLFELVDPTDIHAALTVYEKDYANVQPGQEVIISLANDSSKKYYAEVILATHNLDENRAGMLHCHFEKHYPELMPGMYLNAEIALSGRQMYAVPEDAVVRYKSKYYVFLVEAGGKFRLTEIQTGATDNGMIGLMNNNIDWSKEVVVTHKAFTLLGAMMNKPEEE